MHTLTKIARLYYLENLTQQQIATKLNLSRMKVHRLLLKAKEEGIAEIKINEPNEDYSALEIELEKRYGVKECFVVQSSEYIERMYERMAHALSIIFERDLKNGMHIGFGWGTTLRGVAEKIYFNRKYEVKIVPMVGGMGSTEEKIHANSIVTLVSEKLGGEGFILNCPAIVKNKKTRDTFMTEKTVRDVLSIADKVAIAVVSLGYVGSDITIRKMNLISDAELGYLNSLDIIGDVNANFINENGNAIKNKFQDKIITIDLQNLKKIKNVIGVAFGKKKVPILKAALSNSIIDTLITDNKSALDILEVE